MANLSFDGGLCKFCFNKMVKALKCSRCFRAYYCSKQCQTKDWRQHKEVCQIKDASEVLEIRGIRQYANDLFAHVYQEHHHLLPICIFINKDHNTLGKQSVVLKLVSNLQQNQEISTESFYVKCNCSTTDICTAVDKYDGSIRQDTEELIKMYKCFLYLYRIDLRFATLVANKTEQL